MLNGEKGWAIGGHDPENRSPRQIPVFPARPVTLPEYSRLVVRICQEALDNHTIGRFRLAFSADDPGMLGVGGSKLPPAVKDALAADAASRTPQQKSEIAKFYRANVDGPIRQAQGARDEAKKSVESFRSSLPSAMVMEEGPVREAFVLNRGEYDKRAEAVKAALPAFLRMLAEGGATPAERIGHGLRLAIGRQPTAAELAALVHGFESDLATFSAARAVRSAMPPSRA